MLILPKHLSEPEKNPVWMARTPNEAYRDDLEYSELVDFFCRQFGLPANPNFFQVRVTSGSVFAGGGWWYEAAELMDKVFWVIQKPLRFYPSDEEPWQAWVLEPLEHLRVHRALSDSRGKSPFAPDQLFLLPCDAANPAWEETSGGYSDHIEHRPEFKPTQEQLDKAAAIDAEAKEIAKAAVDITGDERFTNNDPRYYEIPRKPKEA